MYDDEHPQEYMFVIIHRDHVMALWYTAITIGNVWQPIYVMIWHAIEKWMTITLDRFRSLCSLFPVLFSTNHLLWIHICLHIIHNTAVSFVTIQFHIVHIWNGNGVRFFFSFFYACCFHDLQSAFLCSLFMLQVLRYTFNIHNTCIQWHTATQ